VVERRSRSRNEIGSRFNLAKLYAVLLEHRKYLIDDMTLGVTHYWHPVDEALVEQVRLAIRKQVK
jgi:hypothetical protein